MVVGVPREICARVNEVHGLSSLRYHFHGDLLSRTVLHRLNSFPSQVAIIMEQ